MGDLLFITDHITLLRDCTAKPTLLNQQLLNLVTESINRIETQVGNVEKVRQAEVDKVKNEKLVAETQPTMQEEPSNILPKETKPSFNLPIPEHANDFLEVIESGGFSLEDEDEDEIVPEVTTSVIESVLKPEEKLEVLDKSKNEIKKAEQNTSVKNLEEDWVNVQKLLNKRMTVGQTSKPFKMSDCAKEWKVVTEKLNSLPATVKKGDSIVIQKTIITIIEHITVWLEIIEQHVIMIRNTQNPQEKTRLSKFVQDQLVKVNQQLTVLKQTTPTIPILRQEVITTVNWCLQSVENQILSIKHSHEQSTEKQIEKPKNKSANIEKSKEGAVHEVKSEKDKPKPATFNLPIPEHANDFMEIIDGGGFSLDSEDDEEECALPDTHAQSLAQIEDMRDSGTSTIVKLDDVESQPQENVMTYTTIIKSKHVRHATYVSKECLDSMDKESVEQVETMKEEGSKIQSIVTEPKYDVKSMVSDVSLCSETEIPSEFSYASALVVGKAKPIEPVIEEPKKPYQYRDITKCPAEEETEPNSKDITDIPKDGFQEFLSKKERRRRKTESQSENQDTIALVDEVQSVLQEQEDFNQDTNLESMMLRIR